MAFVVIYFNFHSNPPEQQNSGQTMLDAAVLAETCQLTM
jgi:hypothetical protein